MAKHFQHEHSHHTSPQLPPTESASSEPTIPSKADLMSGNTSHINRKTQQKESANPPRQNRQSRNQSKQKSYKLLLKICLALFLVAFILELLVAHFGESAILVPFIGSLVTMVVSIIKSAMDQDAEPCEESVSPTARILSGVKNIWKNIKKSSSMFAVFSIAIFLMISVGLAKAQAAGRIVHWVRNAFIAIDPIPEEVPLLHDDLSESQETSSAETIQLEESRPSAIPLEGIQTQNLFLTDPNRIRQLTMEERSKLYFLSGEYKMDNWWDNTAVMDAIRLDWKALEHENKPNLFLDAPEDIKSKASDASELERSLKNSEELDALVYDRESIYKDYPMYELAVLIAEDHSRFGIAYDECQRNPDTTEYYYGMAIHWYREALRHNPSKSEVEHLLRFIGHRYHDLAACLPDSENQKRAIALADAYYNVADEVLMENN